MAPTLASCAQCNTVSRDLKLCNSCRAVVYCNRTCQKAHWKAHKVTCRTAKVAEDKAVKEEAVKPEAKLFTDSEKVGEVKITSRSVVVVGRNEQGDLLCVNADGEKVIIPAGTKLMSKPNGGTLVAPLIRSSLDESLASMSEERRALFKEDYADMAMERCLNKTAQDVVTDERDMVKLMKISAEVKAKVEAKTKAKEQNMVELKKIFEEANAIVKARANAKAEGEAAQRLDEQ